MLQQLLGQEKRPTIRNDLELLGNDVASSMLTLQTHAGRDFSVRVGGSPMDPKSLVGGL